jgi:hypothetical protein
VAGDAVALSNGGAPDSDASAWTPDNGAGGECSAARRDVTLTLGSVDRDWEAVDGQRHDDVKECGSVAQLRPGLGDWRSAAGW